MNKISFQTLAEPLVEKSESLQEILQALPKFQELKNKMEGSKAELIVVSIRMTKAEKRALKKLSGDLDRTVQDIVRRGIELVRLEEGLRDKAVL